MILDESSDEAIFNAISDCTSIRNIGLNEYMIKDRHVIILPISWNRKPVDENFIFWSKTSVLNLPVSSYEYAFNLFELYSTILPRYSSITPETELYCKYGENKTACCRLFLSRKLIRYYTKLITLRR